MTILASKPPEYPAAFASSKGGIKLHTRALIAWTVAALLVLMPGVAMADGWGTGTGGGGGSVILDNGWTGSFNCWSVGCTSTFTSLVENTNTGQTYYVTSVATIQAVGSDYTAGVTTTSGLDPVNWCWGAGCDGNLPPPPPPPTSTISVSGTVGIDPVPEGASDTITASTSGPVASVSAGFAWGGSTSLTQTSTGTWVGSFTAPPVTTAQTEDISLSASGTSGQSASGSTSVTVDPVAGADCATAGCGGGGSGSGSGGTSGGTGGGGSSGGGSGGGGSGTPQPWSVSLATSASPIQTGQGVTLTATASSNVGPTPYWLVIESSSGNILASCGSGTTCATSQSHQTAQSQTFRAYIADANGSDIQAASPPVTVQWQAPAPTVTAPVLTPDPAYPGQQTCATVTATNAKSVSLSLPGGRDLALTGSGSNWSGCFAAPAPGTYSLTATANGPGGSGNASGTLTVRAPSPTAAFAVAPDPAVASWQTVTYTDQSLPGGWGASIASEHWTVSGPGGSWSGASALPTMFQTPGSYTVTLQVVNNYGASASVTHTLTVVPAPTLSIQISPTTAESGQQVTVSAVWSGWDSASIDVAAFGAGVWPQGGSGTWSRPFTLTDSGNYSACIVGSLAGQSRQTCASTTVLAPTAPILTQ